MYDLENRIGPLDYELQLKATIAMLYAERHIAETSKLIEALDTLIPYFEDLYADTQCESLHELLPSRY